MTQLQNKSVASKTCALIWIRKKGPSRYNALL